MFFVESFCWHPQSLGSLPKVNLDHVEEALGDQIHSNTKLKGCRKVKSKEFEIGGAKFQFCQKLMFFVKFSAGAPVMGDPKLEWDHVEEVLGWEINSNTKLELCWKVKSEEFEIGNARCFL